MRPRRSGLTIIECLLAVTILGFSVLVVSYTLVAAEANARAGDSLTRSARLAHDLIEEMISRPYEDPDGESGELDRPDFDDIGDYDGYEESPGQVKDATGAPYDAASQVFARSVTVTPTVQAITGLEATFEGMLVTVTIREPGKGQSQFTRFIPKPTEP